MDISLHFTYEEAIHSQTAERNNIDNNPNAVVLETIKSAGVKMDKVRELLGVPVIVSSWYRCLKLNNLLSKATHSQHIDGEAIDFISPKFGSPLAICRKIIENKELIGYDQLILEHTWVHISFAILTKSPRQQVLSLLESGGYAYGLTDKLANPL